MTSVANAVPNQAQLALRKAFSMFPTGVVAVCGLEASEPVGMAVNSFSSVSLDPPLVSICVARNSGTWPRLSGLPHVGLSVLGAGQALLSRQLASKSANRFEGASWQASDGGAVFIEGATLWLDCAVRDHLAGGDHEIVLLEVLTSRLFPDTAPLVFHQSQYLGLSGTA
ncbi:flavin reductase family protein [Devosia lacusdianchii]|jgi:flavin reductase (DIM6/NTAB) family NADH-FMN oxidoreductase RutF|uniref:flavin reductase family protein n=1 Tax=Devosia lacusdianchii TaxID=2917991 RepID=UPI001F056058|nr:flavin reductase family protein [Devosia sp. JXJ CY 41]